MLNRALYFYKKMLSYGLKDALLPLARCNLGHFGGQKDIDAALVYLRDALRIEGIHHRSAAIVGNPRIRLLIAHSKDQMKTEELYIDDALFLFNEFGNENVTFYDDDSLVHTMKSGVMNVATMESDYTTYQVALRAGIVCVTKSCMEQKQKISPPMEDEDFVELANQLAYFAGSIRAQKALEGVDMRDMARRLLDVLFADPALGERPGRAPSLKKNSLQIAQAIGAVLKKAKRQAQFEWKEWADDGVRVVNKMGALKALGIKLAPPGTLEKSDTDAASDYCDGVLNWFYGKLSARGLMLIALAPLDELQTFSLVNISQLDDLRRLLKQLDVRVEVPSAIQQC